MKLKQLSDQICEPWVCPAVYETDEGDILVQGYKVGSDERASVSNLADGEDVVRLPRDVFLSAAKKVKQ